MTNRPTFIDLRSQSHNGFRGNGEPSPRSGLSPRLHHAGDVPPHLSPLDAFAAQSRMLAKQLDEGDAGKRLSRLPPLVIESTLQNRAGYFRSMSAEPASDPTSPRSGGVRTAVEDSGLRPKSVYPQVGGSPNMSPAPLPRLDSLEEEQFRGRQPRAAAGPAAGPPFFEARKEQSPATFDREYRSSRSRGLPPAFQPRPSVDSIYQRREESAPNRLQDGSLTIGGYDSRALAPPRSPFAQRAASPRSMSDSSDDDLASRVPTMSPHRNPSIGSGLSSSPTGISPGFFSTARSPSISSERSVGGSHLPKPAFNFSRPLSRASMTGVAAPAPVEIPTRQASSDSQPSFVLADDTAHTPVSMHGESFPDTSTENAAAPSYVYSTFSLPRGKTLQRNSLIFQENLNLMQFSWEQPLAFSDTNTILGGAPPSPPSRPSTSSKHENTRPSLDPGRIHPARLSFEAIRPPTDNGTTTPRASAERPTSASADSSSTIKARPGYLTPAAELSAEELVTRAIEYHEAGALTKSTYHLRLAARQNHPTGMLLYALACRHGWGMRPNQKEGVAWLRKAADLVSLEMADDDEVARDGQVVDLLEKKAKKAQFALSIYELGVSHMNGWGIEQDKVLALRCFEIAGSWGDADALAEAGFCYAQGLGCKKDLKKSAGLYRQAEAKGISMIGNSWIYKSKYNDDTQKDSKKKPTERGRSSTDHDQPKARNKSRTRTMFGRMKSHGPDPLPS